MADPQTPTPAPKSPLWLRLVLIGSIGLNLLIVGVVAGAILSPDGPRAQRAELAQRIAAVPFLGALEPQDRREVLRSLRDQPPAVQATAATAEAARGRKAPARAMLTAIRAEPFVPEDVLSLIEAQRKAGQDRQMRSERALVSVLTDMSPAERAAYAVRLEKAFERLGPPPHKKK